LSRTATQEEIQKAYRRLAGTYSPSIRNVEAGGAVAAVFTFHFSPFSSFLTHSPFSHLLNPPSLLYRCPLSAILHPDRHARTPSLKSAADARFAQLQHAFEVLSDPHRRAVYDELGEEGLKTQWEVGVRGKTASEVRCFLALRREEGRNGKKRFATSPEREHCQR
jgi:curved DNA-binding protein CbpA